MDKKSKIIGWTTRRAVEKNPFCEGDILPYTGGCKARYNLWAVNHDQLLNSDGELKALLDKIKSGEIVKEVNHDG